MVRQSSKLNNQAKISLASLSTAFDAEWKVKGIKAPYPIPPQSQMEGESWKRDTTDCRVHGHLNAQMQLHHAHGISEAASHWSLEMKSSVGLWTSVKTQHCDSSHFLAFLYFTKPKLHLVVIPTYEWVKTEAKEDRIQEPFYYSYVWKKKLFIFYVIRPLSTFYFCITFFPPVNEQK